MAVVQKNIEHQCGSHLCVFLRQKQKLNYLTFVSISNLLSIDLFFIPEVSPLETMKIVIIVISVRFHN